MCLSDSIATTKTLNVEDNLSPLYPYSVNDSIGDRFIKVRKNNNISQIELTRMLEFKFPGCLANIENGQKYPSPETIIKLHNMFGDLICIDDYTKFITSDYGNKFVDYRTKNNLTQKQLSELLHVCPSTVRRLERGEYIKKYKYDKIKDNIEMIVNLSKK